MALPLGSGSRQAETAGASVRHGCALAGPPSKLLRRPPASSKPPACLSAARVPPTSQLVYEKERRLRTMMKMHGLGDVAYWAIQVGLLCVRDMIVAAAAPPPSRAGPVRPDQRAHATTLAALSPAPRPSPLCHPALPPSPCPAVLLVLRGQLCVCLDPHHLWERHQPVVLSAHKLLLPGTGSSPQACSPFCSACAGVTAPPWGPTCQLCRRGTSLDALAPSFASDPCLLLTALNVWALHALPPLAVCVLPPLDQLPHRLLLPALLHVPLLQDW